MGFNLRSTLISLLLGFEKSQTGTITYDSNEIGTLDNISQKKISESLDKLNCTRIVIAHRLSTIKNCGRILVLDQGHIVEDGSYKELLERGGIFADLVEKQL